MEGCYRQVLKTYIFSLKVVVKKLLQQKNKPPKLAKTPPKRDVLGLVNYASKLLANSDD